MNSLFDIVGEFEQLYEMATSDEEQAEQVFIDTLDSLKGELTEKASGYVAVMNRLQMEQDKADEIVKRYTAIKNARKNAIQRMKDACMYACDALGVKEIDAGDVKIRVKNNGGQLPLVIDKPENVPENMTKVTIEPDNDKIRKYLESNACEWAHLGERGKHIEVK